MYKTVGKQTFNSLFNKAKAKYSEYQAEREAPGRPKESNWGENGTGYPGRGGRQDQSWRQPPDSVRRGEQFRQGSVQGKKLGGDSASFVFSSYFDE